MLRSRVLPIAHLAGDFGAGDEAGSGAAGGREDLSVVTVQDGGRQIGLVVDQVLGEQEVVVRALGPRVGDIPGISWSALLGDGAIVPIVDVAALVRRLATDRDDRNRSDAGAAEDRALAHTA